MFKDLTIQIESKKLELCDFFLKKNFVLYEICIFTCIVKDDSNTSLLSRVCIHVQINVCRPWTFNIAHSGASTSQTKVKIMTCVS